MPTVRRRRVKTGQSGVQDIQDDIANKDAPTSSSEGWLSWTQRLFGFTWQDFTSWSSFVRLLNRPCDPATLALYRILFGLLMVLDTVQERGLSFLDYRLGDREECRFPLFNFLQVLPLEWMYVIYLLMALGAAGIMLGFFFKLSCIAFILPYWYVFFLEKSYWNNHSYLFGLNGIMFLFSSANRYASIDSLIWPKMKNTHIPLWNYTLFRFQFFLVYFVAGLKKLERDWVTGYSMDHIASHWVFAPFTLIFTEEQISLVVIHWGGLTIDTFLGFFLFFDALRPYGLLVGDMFHTMNSQIFSIGMFPYAMIASHFVFSAKDLPKKAIRKLPSSLQKLLPTTDVPGQNAHCVYVMPEEKHEERDDGKDRGRSSGKSASGRSGGGKLRMVHNLGSIITVTWMLIQAFLPYSHSITQGYNNWTNGLYGYSWDMMVHSWNTLHVRVTYVNKDTGEIGYLDPNAWKHDDRRWTTHADMVKQYAHCIQGKLRQHGIPNTALYFDIWRSLNNRFQQRIFDPRVDILEAEWSPFQPTKWVLPLLVDLSDWREKLHEIEQNVHNGTNHTDVVFIADFPGLVLENYVQDDLNETRIQVLEGEVVVEITSKGQNYTLQKNEEMQIPSGEYHSVYTVSTVPSCYMYTYTNRTGILLAQALQEYEKREEAALAQAETPSNETEDEPLLDLSRSSRVHVLMQDYPEEVQQAVSTTLERKYWTEKMSTLSIPSQIYALLSDKIYGVQRSSFMVRVAVASILRGEPFHVVFDEYKLYEEQQHRKNEQQQQQEQQEQQ